MAFQYTEKNGFYQTKKGLWGIVYTAHTGKRTHEVVATSLSEAREIKRRREAQECLFKQNPQLAASRQTVNEVAPIFIENHLAKLKSKSNRSMFARFQKQFGHRELGSITPLDMSHYYYKLAAETSYSNANRNFAVIGKFFNELKKWGLFFQENPCMGVEKKPAEPFQPHPLNKQEIGLILQHLASYIQPAIKFCIGTGVRRKELLGLRWEDIDFNTKTILLRETKTQKSRMLGINSDIENILKEVGIKKTGPVFPLTNWELRYQINHAAKKAGIPHTRLHDLRHTFAKNFLDRDGKLYDLQNLMGHSSIKTTQKYMKFKKEEIAQKMSVMDGFFDSLPSANSPTQEQ